ncbi:putative aminopeptidase W07G4.4 [Agrilus planipennis]|uniref:Aminopeptidase W07G4.4 n=1 Tax=Agrilus planipennis TaxID=224129 RepID=A0A7F5R0M3_AGRPL|nr:putative aminopeptidase W07G4.4 [Agrilus planipennis]
MADKNRLLSTHLKAEKSLLVDGYDCLILVYWSNQTLKEDFLREAVDTLLQIDPSLKTEIAIHVLPSVPAGRLVFAPTGPLDEDYDDVRSFGETAAKGIRRAIKARFRRPLLYLQKHPTFKNAELVSILGALESTYVNIQVREYRPDGYPKLDFLGVYTEDFEKTEKLINLASVLESGRYVARDIGGADPERMTPPRIQEYVEDLFKNTDIKINVISDVDVFSKDYPLFEAVNRAASNIDRHKGRIIYLEYVPQDPSKITETLFLVGKGVTYDTGGANIKTGGAMAGMSYDKCGAAAVVGFFQVVQSLKPENIRVVGALAVVRNSVGSDAYVSDELIQSRSGALVRVTNTDAEGRMIMADVLCKLKEEAVHAVNPHLFTIATLTGHAALSAGEYTIVIDNGPARKAGTAYKLQNAGEEIGDPFEVSIFRRDELLFPKGRSDEEDIVQSRQLASSARTSRGHQGPAGFLLLASGLEKHGSADSKPLKFTHIDIAGSAGNFPHPSTGTPVLALANAFLLN